MLWFIICSQTQATCSLRKLSCEDEELELEDVTEGKKTPLLALFLFWSNWREAFFLADAGEDTF